MSLSQNASDMPASEGRVVEPTPLFFQVPWDSLDEKDQAVWNAIENDTCWKTKMA